MQSSYSLTLNNFFFSVTLNYQAGNVPCIFNNNRIVNIFILAPCNFRVMSCVHEDKLIFSQQAIHLTMHNLFTIL